MAGDWCAVGWRYAGKTQRNGRLDCWSRTCVRRNEHIRSGVMQLSLDESLRHAQGDLSPGNATCGEGLNLLATRLTSS